MRQTQERLILAPVLARLRRAYPGRGEVEEHLLALLGLLRERVDEAQGYGPANLVALLRALRGGVNTRIAPSVARSAIFSDGCRVASCGDDDAIQVWDLESGERLRTLRRDRPYERLTITGVKGLTGAQKATLRALGAIESEFHRE